MDRASLRSLLVLGLLLFLPACAPRIPNGVLAPGEPVQRMVEGAPLLELRGHELTPLASYEITARVLSTRRYWFDREARLAPIDLALGWGPMSNSGVLEDLSISQSARAFHWSAREMPLEQDQLESHSANVHTIPATAAIEHQLAALHAGDVVTLTGMLVQARATDGWTWTSSLSRTDTGDGACELLLVTQLERR